MKRTIIIFIVSALVLITSGVWYFNSKAVNSIADLLPFLILLLIVGLAVYIGYKRLMSVKRGEPAEDELSKKIMLRTSSVSYFLSIYLWLALMYFSDRITWENHTLIGAGIFGMAVIFALAWLFFNFLGVRNE
ncbi:MAG: hypothetical protein M0Q53_04500 [Prolixibacteraceae bacterium]|jgi:uncharacterized membrane-anchored protein|nr:hypothetical protein [Prolixibacteraceae bacterium]